jgi:two-component system, LuxR family, sensor kinase FixL
MDSAHPHRPAALAMPAGELADAAGAAARRVLDAAHAMELEELARSFAHRLNQPLGAIAAFAQAGARMLATDQPDVARAGAALRDVARLALEAGTETRRIRARYVLEVPSPRRCRLQDLIEEFRPALTLAVASAGGTLDAAFAPGLPDVRVDPLRIQYVVWRLVRESLTGCAPAGAGVSVRLSMLDEDGVVTRIETSGAPGPLDRPGDPFDPFPADEAEGGLSLATCRSIVEAHAGTIGYERLAGGVRRFWFRLPAARP